MRRYYEWGVWLGSRSQSPKMANGWMWNIDRQPWLFACSVDRVAGNPWDVAVLTNNSNHTGARPYLRGSGDARELFFEVQKIRSVLSSSNTTLVIDSHMKNSGRWFEKLNTTFSCPSHVAGRVPLPCWRYEASILWGSHLWTRIG